MISLTMKNEARSKARAISIVAARGPAPVRLLTSTVLRGCNIHHRSTVIRQKVDLGGLTGMYSGKAGPDFARRFLDRFSDLRGRVPESAMPERFVERLRSPTGAPFEEVLFEAILAVDTAMAFAKHNLDPIRFSEIVPTAAPHRVLLVWECDDPRISRTAAEVGLVGCVELLPEELHPRRDGGWVDFQSAFAALEKRAGRRERSTTTAVLALAAKRRGLPCEPLRGPYLRLGHGSLQRLIYASVTEHTSLAASQLARNKHRTNRRLAELHLPIARQIRVATAEEATKAAKTLGYPVVLKPLKEKQAAGVSVGIANPKDIPRAFARAHKTGRPVIVESFVHGQVHRLLVIGGRFVAALKTVSPTVTGDGQRTIAELIEELNRDPLRNGVRLFKVKIDEELERDLELSGHRLGDVLEKDKTVALRAAANVAIGGLHSDVTDSVHPDNREMAILAAKGIGLDIAGIDFVTKDISRSYKEIGGGIIEVNARPGLCMHTWPRYGKSRPVAGAVLDLVFPPGVTGRIPVAIVAGDGDSTLVARDLNAILQASGKSVGLVTRKGSFVNGQPVQTGTRRKAVPILLRDPRVQTLVSSVSLRRTVRRGLGLDTCDAAAIMNTVGDRDPGGIFHQGVAVVVKATSGMLVVSASNKPALDVLSAFEPKRAILVALNPRDPAVMRHVAAGGTVALNMGQRDPGSIVLYREHELIASVPGATGAEGKAGVQRLETRMFAVALAFAMGLSGGDIEAAMCPGRAAVRRARRLTAAPRKLPSASKRK